MPILKM
nr:30S ribosomal protein S19 [Toxicopueraria peduncularis]UBI41645.1 30S ribosomal protein S19 [Toxicopueraria peduncularis]